jgi:hypothetical protein
MLLRNILHSIKLHLLHVMLRLLREVISAARGVEVLLLPPRWIMIGVMAAVAAVAAAPITTPGGHVDASTTANET